MNIKFLENLRSDLKDYLFFNVYKEKALLNELPDLLLSFYSSQNSLKENAERLLAVFGDELILNGKRYTEIIQKRTDKIKNILIHDGIEIPRYFVV